MSLVIVNSISDIIKIYSMGRMTKMLIKRTVGGLAHHAPQISNERKTCFIKKKNLTYKVH